MGISEVNVFEDVDDVVQVAVAATEAVKDLLRVNEDVNDNDDEVAAEVVGDKLLVAEDSILLVEDAVSVELVVREAPDEAVEIEKVDVRERVLLNVLEMVVVLESVDVDVDVDERLGDKPEAQLPYADWQPGKAQ